MIKFIALILGSVLAYMPKFVPALLAWLVGSIVYYLPTGRRRTLLSNLHHAFPEKSEGWRRRMARQSCCRMIEMGLFLLASPLFSKKRIQKILSFSPSAQNYFRTHRESAQISLIPHFSLMESMTLSYACKNFPDVDKETAVIFRPLNNPAINAWVQKTREQWGIKLLSRKEGFKEATEILKRKGRVCILFDQNAGGPGVLGTFFGRLASSTFLPDLLAQKYNPDVYIAYPERTGFWKTTIHIHSLPDPETTPIHISSNLWLENKLKESDNFCADWLWFHNRWNTQTAHWLRFQLNQKKMDLDLSHLHSKTRFWFRMPNWLGDIIMAIPLLRAIKKGRPDAEITLLAQKHFISLLEKLNIADKLIPLPSKGWSYFFHIWKLRKCYPDCHFLFTNSERGDFESRLINAPQRFGMLRPNKRRPFLTDVWQMPHDFDETRHHQTHTWQYCLNRFGLIETPDYSPLQLKFISQKTQKAPSIGFICGTENAPEKRWPIELWRALIAQLLLKYPDLTITLFGTAKDNTITTEVARGFPENKVENLAGKTNLTQFAEALQASKLIICNDTGGMHLANAMGTPVVAIFGPTNPIRTGPIFDAPKMVLQPKNSPPTGGMPIIKIDVPTVMEAVGVMLENKPSTAINEFQLV